MLYRYHSPVDGKMRQAKIGEWSSVSVSAAVAEWEKLRKARDSGVDAATEKRQAAAEARENALRGSNGAADARKARQAAMQRLYALQNASILDLARQSDEAHDRVAAALVALGQIKAGIKDLADKIAAQPPSMICEQALARPRQAIDGLRAVSK